MGSGQRTPCPHLPAWSKTRTPGPLWFLGRPLPSPRPPEYPSPDAPGERWHEGAGRPVASEAPRRVGQVSPGLWLTSCPGKRP